MLKTLDEILIKYAASFDDLPILAPEPPKFDELTVQPASQKEDTETKLPTPIPVPVPAKQRPLSQRDTEEESEPSTGTPEWSAKYHTQEFLKGVKQPYRGWIRDPSNRLLVVKTMDKLVRDNPGNYFSWDLHRRLELLPWLYPAGKQLIEKDPTAALMKEVWRFRELRDLQTELWKGVMDQHINRTVGDPTAGVRVFPGDLFNKMRKLAGEIAASDPEFYLLYIEGKKLTTPQFDAMARRVMREKEDLNKARPVRLPFKTKL